MATSYIVGVSTQPGKTGGRDMCPELPHRSLETMGGTEASGSLYFCPSITDSIENTVEETCYLL